MNKKIVAFSVAMVLLLGVTLGVTFALLTSKANTITNVFVAGKFGTLTLQEKVLGDDGKLGEYVNGNGDVAVNTYEGFTPGAALPKDAQLIFKGDSANTEAWVYLCIDGNWTAGADNKIVYNDGTNDILSFTFGGAVESWIPMEAPEGKTGLWYYYEYSGDSELVLDIISGQVVNVNADLEAADIATLSNINLKFTAYAAQTMKDENGSPLNAEEVFAAAFPVE